MRTFAFGVIAALLAGCSATGSLRVTGSPGPTPSPAAAEHESGPQSPIAFGFFVPTGATQLGPLARFRSERLIAAYESDLRQALVEDAVTDARRDSSANPDGVPDATPPTPPPVAEAADDTFALLDNPPSPDVTISLMRVDRSPTDVVRRMATQIAVALPAAKVKPDDLGSYCTLADRDVRGCQLTARGRTPDGTPVEVTMTVDVGNPRHSPTASAGRPIMTLQVTYLGAVRERPRGSGDLDVPRRLNALTNPPRWSTGATEAALSTVFGLPTGTTLLLSGGQPTFAAAVVRRGRDADLIARQFASRGNANLAKDIVEELNEVRTTYTSVGKDGSRYFGSFVLSARGNYVILIRLPKA